MDDLRKIDEPRVDWQRTAEQRGAEIERLCTERALLLSIMQAAAAEIEEYWSAHCDSRGYGPVNLVRRLKKGCHGGGYGEQPVLRAHEPPFSAFNNHGHDCAGISDRNGHGVSLELVAELLNQMREEWAERHAAANPK